MVDLHDSIRRCVPWIVENYAYNEESCAQSKKVLAELITEMECKATQRLYLMYYLIETLGNLSEDEANQFFTTLLPLPLKKDVATFLTQLVSLAVSLGSRQTLTATSLYIEKDAIKLPSDFEQLPPNLATVSPRFAAVLIDKGYFNVFKDVFTPTLLTTWLQAINALDAPITFSGQPLIRYSLLGAGQPYAELHLVILQSIERRKVGPLSNQFMIDLAANLSNREPSVETTTLVERFAQILVVALQSGVWSKFSNQAKNTLSGMFPDNPLIRTLGTR